ncbi:MAG TPA: hypothetical protein VKV35_02575 [Streptosporangiaceae bacterium]|nr:hypothetical protein [Streptosporangiaceae bacterium]
MSSSSCRVSTLTRWPPNDTSQYPGMDRIGTSTLPVTSPPSTTTSAL